MSYRDERERDRLDRERLPLLERARDEDDLRPEPPARDLLWVELRPRELDPDRLRDRLDDELRLDFDEPDRPLVDPLREPEERLELRLELRFVRRRPFERWSLGTSARTTARVSCGISRWRYAAIRSSSRLMARAILAVSLSDTFSAKASIAV